MKAGMLRAGELRYRCLIEQKTVTQDAQYGTQVVTWTTVAAVWCSAMDVSPSRSEALKTGLVTGTNQTVARIRWRTDIDSSMRITINRPAPTVYQIIGGPAEIGNRQGIEMMLEKYTS